jgi:hypothetical protein
MVGGVGPHEDDFPYVAVLHFEPEFDFHFSGLLQRGKTGRGKREVAPAWLVVFFEVGRGFSSMEYLCVELPCSLGAIMLASADMNWVRYPILLRLFLTVAVQQQISC